MLGTSHELSSPGAGWLECFGFIHLTGPFGIIVVHRKDRLPKYFYLWAIVSAEHLALYDCDSAF